MHSLKKGFSLIELLVVIAIIGILAAVGTTGYQVYIDSTKAAVVKNNALTLLQAISNEDMAQSAGVGGYVECSNKEDLPGCVSAIVSASTLMNPWMKNDLYRVPGYNPGFTWMENSQITLTDAASYRNTQAPTFWQLPCLAGNIGFLVLDDGSLSTHICPKRTITRIENGKKALYFFTQPDSVVVVPSPNPTTCADGYTLDEGECIEINKDF